MKTKLLILLITSVVLSTSCTTLKRYSSSETSGIDNTLAGIDLFGYRLSQPMPENGAKTLFDLSADAQSQFIKILNARYPDNEEFRQAMSFAYLEREEDLPPDNYISKDLRLIFSVSKRRDYLKDPQSSLSRLSPADRIEYLKITLKIPDNARLSFTGWNMYTTEYGSVDIGDISFSRSLVPEASASLTAGKGILAGEVTAGARTSLSRTEEQSLKYRYIKLNGRISDNSIEMEEEGTREFDLAGNITADVALQFERFPESLAMITGLKDSSGRFNEPAGLTIRNNVVDIPVTESIKDTIYASLRMDYIFRNVINGAKTFPEWDDRVKYYQGSVTRTIPLFSSDDYLPHFYCIGRDDHSGKRDLIKLLSPDNKLNSLIFRTYSEASEFHEWLIQYINRSENKGKVVKIGSQALKFRDEDLLVTLAGKDSGFTLLPYYRR